MSQFNQYINDHAEKLDLFTTAITRAHGKNHPEAFDVREIYTQIESKTQKAGTTKPALNEEFSRLREITDNYAVPSDVCETYEAVYNMLSKADEAYSASA